MVGDVSVSLNARTAKDQGTKQLVHVTNAFGDALT